MVAELYVKVEIQVRDCRGRAREQHAAHPVTTEVPPGYDGTTSWFKYSDAVEEWCDLTKVEAKRRGPAIAARLTGRAGLFKERLDRQRLRDPETRVEYLLLTLRPFFIKDLQSVFLYRFFQMLRCNRGQTDHQCWMGKYEIERQKAVDAWLDATTPRPIVGEAAATAEVERLRAAARERLRLEARQAWLGPPADLPAHLEGIAPPEITDKMRQAAIETVWRVARRPRIDQFPISDNLSALMALIMADLNESQRETLMNLIYHRDIELTALTCSEVQPREPKLGTEVWPNSYPFHMVSWTNMKATGCKTSIPAMRVSSMSVKISSGCMMRTSASG